MSIKHQHCWLPDPSCKSGAQEYKIIDVIDETFNDPITGESKLEILFKCEDITDPRTIMHYKVDAVFFEQSEAQKVMYKSEFSRMSKVVIEMKRIAKYGYFTLLNACYLYCYTQVSLMKEYVATIRSCLS